MPPPPRITGKALTPAQRAVASRSARRSAERSEDIVEAAAVTAAFVTALSSVDEAVKGLVKAGKAMEAAHKRASSYRMSRIGLSSRLRPSAVRRALLAVAQDLSAKTKSAADNGLVAPDGVEEAYGRFAERVSVASSLLEEAVRDISSVRQPDAPHAALRHLMDSVTRASAFLSRLVRGSRSAASRATVSLPPDGEATFY